MKKLNKLAVVFLAAAFVFASAIPAEAVTSTEIPTPEQAYYRETSGDIAAGELIAVYDLVDVTPSKGIYYHRLQFVYTILKFAWRRVYFKKHCQKLCTLFGR